MYGDVLDLDPLFRPRLLVYLNLLQIVEHLHALYDLPEHGILAIEMRRRRKRDEELAAIGVRPLVRHADDASRIMSEGRANLVLEELDRGVVDGGRALGLGVRRGTPRLHHEVRYHAVEGAAIVEVGGAQGEEVLGCLGDGLAEDLELELTARGVQLERLLARCGESKRSTSIGRRDAVRSQRCSGRPVVLAGLGSENWELGRGGLRRSARTLEMEKGRHSR